MTIAIGVLFGVTAVFVGFIATLVYTKTKTERINALGAVRSVVQMCPY